MLGVYFLVIVIVAIGTGSASAHLAKNKGYVDEFSINGYFFAGFFLGIYAMIYIAGLPISEKMREEERVKLIQELEQIGALKKPISIESKTVLTDELPQW